MLPLESRSGSVAEPPINLHDIAAKRALLIAEHDDLDCAIAVLEQANTRDDLLIRRLKKRKLHLKDEIALVVLGVAG